MRAAVRRYAFTIVGIAIGVAGLVALGAMAERIVRFIEGGDRFVLGQISVAGRGMGMGAGFTGGGLLPARVLRDAVFNVVVVRVDLKRFQVRIRKDWQRGT